MTFEFDLRVTSRFTALTTGFYSINASEVLVIGFGVVLSFVRR